MHLLRRSCRIEGRNGARGSDTTSNLDPLIDTGSKEGLKDTITSSIVKELSKKAYTIPDDKNPNISNTYSDSDHAVLLMLLRNSLSSSPRAAISRPIESKKEDVYNEFHALTFSTYKKGLSAFNAEFNGYLAKLTMAKIDIDPSLILNYLNIEYLMADILEESRNPATKAYRAAHIANSSNSTPNSNSNPSKKGKNKKKGKKKASYNVEGQNYSAKSAEQASFILGSYNLAIEEEEESDSSSNSSSSSNSNTQLAQLLALKGYKKHHISNSKERTFFKGEKALEPEPLTGTRDLPYILREPVIEGNKVEKAISSPTLKEPNIGHIGLRLLKKTSSITKGLPNFDKIKEADFHCSSYLIEGDTVKIRPRPYNRNPIVLLLVDRKSRYRWVFNLPNKSGPIVANAIKGFFRGLRNGFGRYPTKFHFNGASNKAIYKLLLKYGYNPSTPNIIKLSKALYSLKQSPREWQDKLKILLKSLGYLPLILDLGVFYNTKTCHFIGTYIDNCLFIGPNIGYITDLKKRLNKVYAIEDLGPAAYFLGWLSRSLNRPTKLHLNAAKNLFKYLNSTKDYSISFSYNGNIVADLRPKLSNSSNTTTKLSRDFHSKEGPRPLTTTSTTIVDSRNSKGSSWTSIINSSLVPIGFSDSDFAGDKATSKSTYGYLYKLASRPISWKTKRATTIALSTLEAETDGLTEAIREVQDNQGSIIVANDPALHARTKYTLLKFQYVREQVKAKIVTIIYLNTKFNSTSYLTAL
ncbi:hypothetical protein P8C59_008469 [Phyllachora maydis]|uniref:Reverse transcriptase Ty1/copia-type domain-containing protein n=1 Tax=Phyllachora maydis TaxID=1825666 RepID=A0AAD9IB65_9PEZI|nr:hypothetical protein P8C59_008469 [Phyllachora maydis]